jgi:hypothetical protein
MKLVDKNSNNNQNVLEKKNYENEVNKKINKNGSTMSSLQKKQSFSRGGNMRHRKSDANFTNN